MKENFSCCSIKFTESQDIFFVIINMHQWTHIGTKYYHIFTNTNSIPKQEYLYLSEFS